MKHGSRFRHGYTFLRLAFDAGLVMGLIWLISLGTAVHHNKSFVVLSLASAAIAAVDLAFLRHLRRAYASPRRGVWRRD